MTQIPNPPQPNNSNGSFWKGFALGLLILILVSATGWYLLFLRTERPSTDEDVVEIAQPTEVTPQTNETKAPIPVPEPEVVEPVYEDEARNVFNRYLQAWNDQDLKTQISLLHSTFKSIDKTETLTFSEYIQRKRRLIGKYEWVSITPSDIYFEKVGNNYLVTYYQHFESPKYESWGTNKFYFHKRNGKVSIYKEIFQKDHSQTY